MQTLAILRAELELISKRSEDQDIQGLARLTGELISRIEELERQLADARGGKPHPVDEPKKRKK